MKRIMVTGGAGFIGSALCRYLVKEKKIRILNVDKLTYAGNLSSLKTIENSPLYSFEQADICNKKVMVELFNNFQPDTVMHLAAESHVDRSIKKPDAFIQTNITGTYTLLECAREYWNSCSNDWKKEFRFHHVSTDEVYGSLDKDGLFKESTAYDPHSPYSASKAASDHLVRAWFHTYGLPIVISNCSNNYGPFQFPEKLIPHTILQALSEKKIPIFGKGNQIRDWLYIDDHVQALVKIAKKGKIGETYNIGGNNEHSNLEVAKTICTLLDKTRPRNSGSYSELIQFVEDRPGHDMRYAIDASKLKTELNWKPKNTFSAGIQKTIQWYLENAAWWGPLLKNK